MQPEDIDKLFRERLADHAPTPPAFVWAEIEAEIQPRRRRPVLWLAAAAVALLALLGAAWWVMLPPTGLATQGTIATITPQKSAKKAISEATLPTTSPSSPVETPATQPAAVVATTDGFPAQSAGVQPDQALETSRLAVASRPTRAAHPTPASPFETTSPPAEKASGSALALAATTATPEPQVVLAANSEPTPIRPVQALAAASTSPPMGPIEVEVRPATVATTSQEDRRPRLGSLLQQARNVVRGDKLSLTEAGLPEMVTVQARVGHRTLTKVIQL